MKLRWKRKKKRKQICDKSRETLRRQIASSSAVTGTKCLGLPRSVPQSLWIIEALLKDTFIGILIPVVRSKKKKRLQRDKIPTAQERNGNSDWWKKCPEMKIKAFPQSDTFWVEIPSFPALTSGWRDLPATAAHAPKQTLMPGRSSVPCNKLVEFKSSKPFGRLGTISVSTGNYSEETETSIVITHARPWPRPPQLNPRPPFVRI